MALKQAEMENDIEERPVKRRRVSERWTYVPIPASDTDESTSASPEPSKSSPELPASGAESPEPEPSQPSVGTEVPGENTKVTLRRSLRSSLCSQPLESDIAETATKMDIFPEKQHLARRHSLRFAASTQLSEDTTAPTVKGNSTSQGVGTPQRRLLRSRANSEQHRKSSSTKLEVTGGRGTPMTDPSHLEQSQLGDSKITPTHQIGSQFPTTLTSLPSNKQKNRSRRSVRLGGNLDISEGGDSLTEVPTVTSVKPTENSKENAPFPTEVAENESADNRPACEYSAADTIISIPPPALTQQSSSASSGSGEPPSTQSSQISQTSSRASLPNLKGKDLFDSMIWTDALTTSIFYMFISSLREKIRNEVKATTDTHKFIKALRDGGRLVRNYTQNIDALEAREGLCTELERGPGNRARFGYKAQREHRPADGTGGTTYDGGVEVVMLHGSLVRLRCSLCGKLSNWDEADRESTTSAGKAPDCPLCSEHSAKREGRGRRRVAIGRLRPDIVLYGEQHPNEQLVGSLITHDLGLGPDVLLILGTSLRVHSLKVMVREFAKAVHARGGKVIFVNHTKPPESIWGDVIDYWVQWDCDAWVLDLKGRRADIWLPRGAAKNLKKKEAKQKPEPKNPVSLRDDKHNGVYLTLKSLDSLAKFKDAEGKESPRSRYHAKRSFEKGAIPTDKRPPTIQVQLPARDPKPLASETVVKSKKRPRLDDDELDTLGDDKLNGVHLLSTIMKSLKGIRYFSPGRQPLEQLSRNLNSSPQTSSSSDKSRSKSPSYYPNLPGLQWPFKKMAAHLLPPYCTPSTKPYRTPSHSSLRSLREHTNSSSPSETDHWPSDTIVVSGSPNSQDAIVVEVPGETQDAIVVAVPHVPQRRREERQLPSPRASSDSLTPKSQRSKTIRNMDCILSSPPSFAGYNSNRCPA